MAKEFKLRRGTTAEHSTFVGASGELTVDTTKKTVVVHDATTPGGTPLAKEDLSNIRAAILAAVYPVGSIYTNAGSTTNPATLLGFGTWIAFGAGRVVVGISSGDVLFDTLEETGGSKDAVLVTHAHTFAGTIDSAGEHQHTIPHVSDSATSGDYISGNDGPNNQPGDASPTASAGAHTHTVSGTISSEGSSATNANLQPYITVAMWKRTA
jgi:hypothetical protein